MAQDFDFKTKEELLSIWEQACDSYYNSDDPDMSDIEFDELTELLRKFNDPQVNAKLDGIYQDGSVEAVTEKTLMLSLFKKKYKDRSSIVDCKSWFKTAQEQLMYAMKFDGMAIKITKKLSTIQLIQTRGGLDVTRHLINHPDIVELLYKYPEKDILHGEMLCRKSVFVEKYADEYENPRNFVPSVIKSNNPSKEVINSLNFMLYSDGVSPLGSNWKMLTPEDWYRLEEIHQHHKNSDYPCDGLVIGYKVDEQVVKDNYPLNMVAIKFKAPTAKTKVIDIEWTQKKSGKLTPVLVVEPTELDGSTVERATAYNYDRLKANRIGVGAIISITKSGDIIPIVDSVIVPAASIKMPSVDYEISGKHLIAIDRTLSRIHKFTLALKLLEIDGIGETTAIQIGEIVDYDIINLFNKSYKPDIRQVLGGGKLWEKFEQFYSIATLPLDRVIELLQFDKVGKVLSRKVALIITKKLSDTSGIDKEILSGVCRGEGFFRIQSAIKYLAVHGIKVIAPIEINEDTITYEMSGNPPAMTKDEFKKKMGLKYPNSVHCALTKESKLLVVDSMDSTTSKMNKARKYNIPIKTYSEILKEIGG